MKCLACACARRPSELRLLALILLSSCYSCPSWSSNGVVSPGNGAVQLGLAGAGTAMAEDAAATLRNPAAGVWIGNSMITDLGVASANGGFQAGPVGGGSQFGLFEFTPGSDTSVKGVFPIPSFARNWRLSDDQAWGLGFTASGLKSLSSNTNATLARGIPLFTARCDGTFGGGQRLSDTTDLTGLCGNATAAAGVNLAQAFLSSHWAYRVTPDLAVGIAPVVLLQRVSVHGLGAFTAFSNYPSEAGDNGGSYSYGGGVRAGLLWRITQGIGLGLAYQSQIYETAFDKYRGLIIGGSLDFAPIYDLGFQFHLAPGNRLLLDAEYIDYGQIKPLAHKIDPQQFTDNCFVPRLLTRSLSTPAPLDGCLGGSSGPGFGWQSIAVFKLGYEFNRGRLTLRAGYSYGENPVVSGQVFSSVFAPAITKQHAAIGVSWQLNPRLALGWALIDSIECRVEARNVFSNAEVQLLQGKKLVGVNISSDPRDQIVETHLGVWQSQFGLTWTM